MRSFHALLYLAALLPLYAESKRHPLQDYQKTDGVRLLAPPDSASMSRGRNLTVAKCARRCTHSRRVPYTCRAFSYDHKSRKCYLLSFDSLSAGTHAHHKLTFDLYENKDFVRECIIGTGLGYKGRRFVTLSGVQCQRWDSTIPHEHAFLPAKNKKADLQGNFCRNPDNATTGPWCFTTDSKIRHQGCSLPQCSEVECMACNGESYRGPLDHTETGRECQRWDLNEPHTHLYHPKRYPDKGLRDNFCRNPDGRQRPWCYTTDPNTPWEYCSIKQCDSESGGDVETTTHCFRGRGEGYRGTVGVAPEGVVCQRWDAQYPHQHPYTPQNYGCKDLRENYCRNPDGGPLPWCFSTDPNVAVVFCTNIPRCSSTTADTDECYVGIGDSYRGEQSRTRSGLSCSPWRNHLDMDQALLSAGLEGGFCRNPDRDKHGPWCYTNSSLLPWDYCSIRACEVPTAAHPTPGDGSRQSCFFHKQVRIVGGGPVDIREGSWMVSIQKGNTHWCGGSLLREEWVLTDRQCFSSCVPDLSEYSVWLGTAHLNDSGGGGWRRQEVRIAQVICGPEGSGLALLHLKKPALPTEHVRIVQLPVADCTMQEGKVCAMYGWGETKGTGHEGRLKRVHLPVVGIERCRRLHSSTSLRITSARLCAGGQRDQGVCERDYGGPLVCEEGRSKVIVGVSVHGRGCARHNRPGIFVNVAFYTSWIHKVFKHYPASQDGY